MSNKRGGNKPKLDLPKDLLKEMYKSHTIKEIAHELGVSEKTIRRRFKEYHIETGIHTYTQFIKKKKPRLKKVKQPKPYTIKSNFEEVYNSTRSLALVCKHYGISMMTATTWKKRHNIPTIHGVSEEGKSLLNSHKPYTNKEWLIDMYERYSIPEIAEICGVHRDTIRDWKNRFNIKSKTVKEQRQKKSNFGNKFIYEKGFDKKSYLTIYQNEGRITTKMKKFIVDTVGKCQCCGYDEVLDLHHLDENHFNNKPENHLVVCPNCHAKIHRLGMKVDVPKTLWVDLVQDSYQGGH